MQTNDKRTHVKAWQNSGLTKAAYAREQGINGKTFSRWCRQFLMDVNQEQRLLPVTIKTTSPSKIPAPINLRLSSGSVLELPADISPRWLGE
jgi:hypothetical protein